MTPSPSQLRLRADCFSAESFNWGGIKTGTTELDRARHPPHLSPRPAPVWSQLLSGEELKRWRSTLPGSAPLSLRGGKQMRSLEPISKLKSAIRSSMRHKRAKGRTVIFPRILGVAHAWGP